MTAIATQTQDFQGHFAFFFFFSLLCVLEGLFVERKSLSASCQHTKYFSFW